MLVSILLLVGDAEAPGGEIVCLALVVDNPTISPLSILTHWPLHVTRDVSKASAAVDCPSLRHFYLSGGLGMDRDS